MKFTQCERIGVTYAAMFRYAPPRRPVFTRIIRHLSFALTLTALVAQASIVTASTKDESWTFSVQFENDLFGSTDQFYTNGVKLNWSSPDLTQYRDNKQLPKWTVPLINQLPLINQPGLQRNIAFSLGQKIFTPINIRRTDLIKDDRPYAGWLYFGTAFHNKNFRELDTLELQIGLIGPASLAENAQNSVHKYRDIAQAKGWNNQLHNELGVALIYDHKKRIILSGKTRKMGMDIITHYGGALGNVYTYLNAGAEIRYGWNIPTDFGTSLIRPGGDSNSPSDSSDPRFRGQHGISFYGFTALSGRMVARNIFLDGNSFRDSHDVDKRHLIGDAMLGIGFILGRTKITYAQVFKSKTFKKQKSGHHFGSLSFSYSY